MRVHVVTVPTIPHNGRVYIDGTDLTAGGREIIVWVVESLLNGEDSRCRLEHCLNAWVSRWFSALTDSA
jgi:hypothetical protein